MIDRQLDPLATLRFMGSASPVSRDNLFLKLMDRDQDLAKRISAMIEERIEICGLIRVAQWQREGLILVEGHREKG